MKISTLFDINYKFKNSIFRKLVYKGTKVISNLLYPRMVKINNSGIDENSEVIVSLTSFPERIQTVWITISTLLTQTVKPHSVILWLADEQFPNKENDLPENLLRLRKYGLTIKFCDNIFSHKKYYYTMKNYPDNSVITVDDDVLYPEYLIEELIKTSNKFPNTVCCTWAHKIKFSDLGKIESYNMWETGTDGRIPSYEIVPIGCGGVFYPKEVLDKEVFNKAALKELCINADDLWLKMMANKHGTKSVRIDKPPLLYFTIISTQKGGLRYSNVGMNRNDYYLNNIINSYPEVLSVYADK